MIRQYYLISGTSFAMMQNLLSGFFAGGLYMLSLKEKSQRALVRLCGALSPRTIQRTVIVIDCWEDFVDPEYRQLMPLVKSMATLIKEDYHWVKEEKYKHPEYLHDALQRVILKFVLENKEASFMDLQKSTEHRQVEQVFIAPPQIYRRSPPPLFVPLASTRDKKRKATSPNMYGTQLLSAASHGDKSGHDNLMVCLIA